MPAFVTRTGLGRLLAVVLAASASVGTLAALIPALAQQTPAPAVQAGERVELIMGGLPPAGSKEYKALIAHAGRDAKGTVLPLTRCEIWNVHHSRVEAVKKAAAAKNVSVKPIDDTWNQMLAAMPPAAMDEKSKSMKEMAMQSKATAGMEVMATRTAPMVEYALTKGMHERDPARQPMTVKIALDGTRSVTAVRRSVEIKGDRCIWRGVIEGTENPVTIMWWGSGRVSGTINTGERIYQLKPIGPDAVGVVESMADKLPDEHARISTKRMIEMKMQDDTFFKQGDSSAARPRREDTQSLQDDAAKDGVRTAKVDPKALRRAAQAASKPARKGSRSVIDVMIVYTAKAAAHYSDIGKDLIELAIEDTNESFRKSGVPGVSARLVHTHLTDYDEVGAEHFDHVWRMIDRDRFMEEVPRLRNEKKADVVVLIVDDPSGCGLATRVAADAEEAFAVVHHECAATSYSIPHEIGHLLGARHDRNLDKGGAPFAYGHGFVSPDLKWRTMMSYKAGCSGCPRLPIWSTPAAVVNGRPAGDQENDNARVIRERAAQVAAFR